jgi:endonuclease III
LQLLGAVLLSARTQETMVRTAVRDLAARETRFTVDGVADMAEEELAGLIKYIHYNKAKAKHLRLAAIKVRDELGRRVPTTEKGLLDIPGIGPTLAPLLAFLFRVSPWAGLGGAQPSWED